MDEFSAFMNSKKDDELVVVDFYTTWCSPCKRMMPIIHQAAREHTKIQFIKVNCDVLEEAMVAMDVSAMPTFVALKGKKEVVRMVGADKEKLQVLVARLEAA